MQLPDVVGLYSPAAQSGKTTVANYLNKRYGYQVVSFATPLKRMAAHFLHGLGYSPEQIDHYMRDGKSTRLDYIGVDSRHIMQTLGTEWGRNCIHPDVWVRMWDNKVKKVLGSGGRVVCDDVRFANEYRAVRQMRGNEFWRVTRPSVRDKTCHASEGFAENNQSVFFDKELKNYASVPELEVLVDTAIGAEDRVGVS